jgi:hypothetical protein
MQHGASSTPPDNLDMEECFGRRPAASSHNATALVAQEDVGASE